MRQLTAMRLRQGLFRFAVIVLLCCWLSDLETPAKAQSWHFVCFGDSRGNSFGEQVSAELLGEMARSIREQHPAFVLFVGDLVLSGAWEGFLEWTNAMAPLYEAGIPVYPVLGNHDLPDIPSYVNLFGPTVPTNGPDGESGRTYAVRYQNALILALDQFAATNTGRVNQSWLEAVLATNELPHVIAFGHYPAFKVYHADCLDDYPMERDAFWESLRRAGGRLYFAGHDHFYDHMRLDDGDGNAYDDLHQVIVGTAGAPIYPDGLMDGVNGAWLPRRIFHEAQWGYVVVKVDGPRLSTQWFHRTAPGVYEPGTDSFSYTTELLPVLLDSITTNGLTLTWSGEALLQRATELNGSFTNVAGASSPYTVQLGESRSFFRLAVPGATR